MCEEFGWDMEDYEMREAKREFKAAMVREFNGLYGTNGEDLESWQKLCRILNIEPVPLKLKPCREASYFTLSSATALLVSNELTATSEFVRRMSISWTL